MFVLAVCTAVFIYKYTQTSILMWSSNEGMVAAVDLQLSIYLHTGCSTKLFNTSNAHSLCETL